MFLTSICELGIKKTIKNTPEFSNPVSRSVFSHPSFKSERPEFIIFLFIFKEYLINFFKSRLLLLAYVSQYFFPQVSNFHLFKIVIPIFFSSSVNLGGARYVQGIKAPDKEYFQAEIFL